MPHRACIPILVLAPLGACTVDPSLSSGGDAADAASLDGSSDVVSEPLPTIDAPSCGNGGVCVDPVPAGWTGPLAVFDQTGGPPAPQAPSCPSNFPTDVFDGNANLSAAAASCGCNCNVSSPGTCGAPTVAIYTGSSCGTTSCYSATISTCTTMTCNTGTSAKVTAPAPVGGACTATPTKTVPPATWTRTGRACQTSDVTTGCAGSSVCVPLPQAPFASTVCILQAGDVACPPGEYSQKFLYYDGVTDTRDCSTCGCTMGTCSGGVVTIWDATGCSGSKITINADGQCHNTNGVTTIAAVLSTPATNTSCSSSGGSPTGNATPSGPTTICCVP